MNTLATKACYARAPPPRSATARGSAPTFTPTSPRIARRDRPSCHFCRVISRALRVDSLSVAIGPRARGSPRPARPRALRSEPRVHRSEEGVRDADLGVHDARESWRAGATYARCRERLPAHRPSSARAGVAICAWETTPRRPGVVLPAPSFGGRRRRRWPIRSGGSEARARGLLAWADGAHHRSDNGEHGRDDRRRCRMVPRLPQGPGRFV